VSTDIAYKAFSPARIGAMVARQWYVLRASWPRILEIVYWPAISMLTWGFTQVWVGEHGGGAFAAAASTLLGGVILWDILVRGSLGFSITFLEEMWSKNIGNLVMSPLTPLEYVLSLAAMSLIRLLIGLLPVSLIAIALFGFNIWAMGLPLIAFFANLILLGWAASLVVSGLVLRHGLGAEGLAWIGVFIMMPFSAIFYPVSVLPEPAQYVAWALPSAYVFEGMRALVIDNVFRADLMVWAFSLNAVYFALAVAIYLRVLESARVAGSLLSSTD
jgi:ABC-2 type transport system permease protein